MVGLDLKPVETVSTSTQIIEQFVEMIRTARLKPGNCLPSETSLAKSLGTSRATIREALSGLKVLGLLESIPGKGNFVKKPSMDYQLEGIVDTIRSRMSFLEALEARRAIEGEVCYLAAKRRTDSALREIEDTLKKCKDVKSVDEFIDADYGFHLALAKASDNRLFIQFIKEALLKLGQPYYNAIRLAEAADDPSSVKRLFGKSYDDHEAIYKAILEGDSAAARKSMISHLQAARQKFTEYCEIVEPDDLQPGLEDEDRSDCGDCGARERPVAVSGEAARPTT
ncbi:MAG: FadR family transcriptional regulator [Firmicutes bacterium]|jgi:GntR family transcriptional repressor for pyruvate dehydrogenase complex|nr:FadR family transcriptional regulator [Bacillota bacterium]MDH7494687.1 FadR/GntR family transcriptional regulator [Bacillota bacterium]